MNASRSKDSLHAWGKAVFTATLKQKLRNEATPYLSQSKDDAMEKATNIYNDFYRTHPGNAGPSRRGLTAKQQSSFLSKLKSGSTRSIFDWFSGTPKKYKLYPQSNDRSKKFESVAQGAFSYRVNKNNSGNIQGDKGRLTVNVQPGNESELLNKMKAEAKRNDTNGFHSYQSKIAAPDRFGLATEDALFYLTAGQNGGHISQNDLTGLSNRVKLDPEKMSTYLAPGLEQISKGVGYAETPLQSPGAKYNFAQEQKQQLRDKLRSRFPGPLTRTQHQKIENYVNRQRFPSNQHKFSSHGMAHSTIIRSALKSTFKHYGDTPSYDEFKAVYNYKLQRHGLDVNNPARRSNIDRNTIQKPWEVPAQPKRRNSVVGPSPAQNPLVNVGRNRSNSQ